MLTLALGLTYTESIPSAVRYALIMPYTVIINVAACRVFRDLRLFATPHNNTNSHLSNVASDLVFAELDNDTSTIALSTI